MLGLLLPAVGGGCALDVVEPASHLNLTQSGDPAVCEGLNRQFQRVVFDPQGCGFVIPGDGGFRPIDWEPVRPLDHLDVLREITQRRWYRSYEPLDGRYHASLYEYLLSERPQLLSQLWDERRDEVVAAASRGEIFLQRARFNVDNGGEAETVYRYATGANACASQSAEKPAFRWEHHVLLADNRRWSIASSFGPVGGEYFLFQTRTLRFEVTDGVNVVEPSWEPAGPGGIADRTQCRFAAHGQGGAS